MTLWPPSTRRGGRTSHPSGASDLPCVSSEKNGKGCWMHGPCYGKLCTVAAMPRSKPRAGERGVDPSQRQSTSARTDKRRSDPWIWIEGLSENGMWAGLFCFKTDREYGARGALTRLLGMSSSEIPRG